MKSFSSFSFRILAAVVANCVMLLSNLTVADDSLPVTLIFHNGDHISGTIIQWNPEQIELKSKDMIENSTFSTKNLLSMKIHASNAPKTRTSASQDITTITVKPRFLKALGNDKIIGSLDQISATHISLNTPYAGKLNIRRSLIKNISISTNENVIYQGPNSISEWTDTIHSGSFTYHNGALISGNSNGNITIPIDLPDKAVISLDHTWKNQNKIIIRFYTNDYTMTTPSSFYELSTRYNTFYMRKRINDRTLSFSSTFARRGMRRMVPALSKRHAHYDLYIDKKKGLIHLYINGEHYDTFKDENTIKDKKKSPSDKDKPGLQFVSDSKSPYSISHLKVKSWNGILPDSDKQNDLRDLDPSKQSATLRNGDAVLGDITGVDKHKLVMQTKFGPIRIPVARLKSINLADDAQDAPKMYLGDIRAYFNDSGSIIVKPISVKGTKMTVSHPAFGKAEFDLRAFKKIDFHVENTKPTKEEPVSTWNKRLIR